MGRWSDRDERKPPAGEGGLDAELDKAVPREAAEAFLVAVSGDHPGRVYALSKNTVILGRAETADICVAHPSVSAEHARIINSSLGFALEDLGSRNGTYVGGQRITRARLRAGDRVRLGTVEFTFLLDRTTDVTVAMMPAGVVPISSTALMVPQILPRYVPPQRPPSLDESGPSLVDIIHQGVRIYRLLQRHARLLQGLAAAGLLLGLTSALLMPPPPSAVAEVRLQLQVKSNPVDNQAWRPPEEEALRFFAGAEREFTQPELVRSTLAKVQPDATDDESADSIVQRLRFEVIGDRLYRATYKERMLGGGQPAPVAFLDAHLKNYFHTEIEKALRVFNAEANFLRGQTKAAEQELATVGAALKAFRQQNADRLPEQSLQTHASRFELEARRTVVAAQVYRMEGELAAARKQVGGESPLAQTKFQSSQVYREGLAAVNRKLSEAYARGLAAGHVEVRRLEDEKVRIEALIEAEMRSQTTPLERRSNAGFQAMENQVETLQAQLRAARNELRDIEGSLSKVKNITGDLPRVESQVQDLLHRNDATKRLHAQLFEKLKAAELKVNQERVWAESRYEIVAPPHLEQKSRAITWTLRSFLGLFLGLLLAAIIIAFSEGRRAVMRTLATMDGHRGMLHR
jgi:pSer/pThr/pTyr-binding forkhead associated (FHA) protein